MSAYKDGIVKWFRGDGTGYIVDPDFPDESIFVDTSAVAKKSQDSALRKGQKVKYKARLLLGRKVATDVQPL